MTTETDDPGAQRSATRAPVGKPIKLQFDDSMDVVEGLCENISIGGMFIEVESTRPQGSLVRFELQLDDSTAIRGLGEVVWMRAQTAGPGRAAGIGIKFRFLEQRDRQLIFKQVSEHIKQRLANRQALKDDGVREIQGTSVPPPAPAGPSAPAPPAPEASPAPVPPPAPDAPPPTQPAESLAAAAGVGKSFEVPPELLQVDAEPPADVPAGGAPSVAVPSGGPAPEDPSFDVPSFDLPASSEPDAAAPAVGAPAAETSAIPEPSFDSTGFAGQDSTGFAGQDSPGFAGQDPPSFEAPASPEPSPDAAVSEAPSFDVPSFDLPSFEEPAVGTPAAGAPATESGVQGGLFSQDSWEEPQAEPEPENEFEAELAGLESAPALAQETPGFGDPPPLAAGESSLQELDDSFGNLTLSPDASAEDISFDELMGREPTATEPAPSVPAIPDPPTAAEYDDDLLAPPTCDRSPARLVLLLALVAVAAAAYFFRDQIFGSSPASLAGSAPTVVVEEMGPADASAPGSGEVPGAEDPSAGSPAAGSPTTEGASEEAAAPPPPPPADAVPPPAVVADPVAVALPAQSGPFDRIIDISWNPVPRGVLVTITGNGTIPEGRYRHFRLDGGSPRVVVRLLGVSAGYCKTMIIPVDGALLKQIRTGYHRKPAGNELHIVLDLANPRAQVNEVQEAASGLEVLIENP